MPFPDCCGACFAKLGEDVAGPAAQVSMMVSRRSTDWLPDADCVCRTARWEPRSVRAWRVLADCPAHASIWAWPLISCQADFGFRAIPTRDQVTH